MTIPDLNCLTSWQFHLPPELIASRPAERRDESRMIVVDRRNSTITHSTIRELPQWLNAGDILVFNNTKVLPARLFGLRTQTGGRWEGLYVEETSTGHWRLLCETRGRLQPGETITVVRAYEPSRRADSDAAHQAVVPQLVLTLIEKQSDGAWIASVPDHRSPVLILEEYGSLPLPPYMGRKLADSTDSTRYQTEFASVPGAVAAPTAGLHFTEALISDCGKRSIHTTELTLHVGIGTFRPVTTQTLSEHCMHEEWCRLPDEACRAILGSRSAAGRTIAVGTTSIRTLESAALATGKILVPWEGRTDLFIRPGFSFQVVHGLLTNFHLPGSTLLVLVSALAGYELIMEAYRQAISSRYRFYSYGDAMLIL
jgi:S-adenosylmethionine:tRNA ribosyltransferase-isomerase